MRSIYVRESDICFTPKPQQLPVVGWSNAAIGAAKATKADETIGAAKAIGAAKDAKAIGAAKDAKAIGAAKAIGGANLEPHWLMELFVAHT